MSARNNKFIFVHVYLTDSMCNVLFSLVFAKLILSRLSKAVKSVYFTQFVNSIFNTFEMLGIYQLPL